MKPVLPAAEGESIKTETVSTGGEDGDESCEHKQASAVVALLSRGGDEQEMQASSVREWVTNRTTICDGPLTDEKKRRQSQASCLALGNERTAELCAAAELPAQSSHPRRDPVTFHGNALSTRDGDVHPRSSKEHLSLQTSH